MFDRVGLGAHNKPPMSNVSVKPREASAENLCTLGTPGTRSRDGRLHNLAQ